VSHWRAATAEQRQRIAATWLEALGASLAAGDAGGLAALIHPDGFWRDLLTFSWKFTTRHGPDAIRAWLAETPLTKVSSFRLEGDAIVGAIGEHAETLEFFFSFETDLANGRGFVRLVPDRTAPAGGKAFTLLTTMRELKEFPEPVGRKRRREDLRLAHEVAGAAHGARRDFSQTDPDVLIIGGGQSGLMLAARLSQLDVSTLVIDKLPNIGDVWRDRYRTLTLHNEICMNHFAYMNYPDNWPVYLPKDKVADWLEFYAKSMDLDVWTGTSCLGGEFDSRDERWTVRLRTADGGSRIMRPKHVVLAVGVSGIASVPRFEGIAAFAGIIRHTSDDTDSIDVKGKSVLVVGVGTSGHDIAQGMHARGANVTMLQRSPITVVSLEPSSVRAYELYRSNDGIRPIADIDMMAASVPYELLARLHKPLNRRMAEDDKELLDGLRKVGFLLENGDDDDGYFLKLLKSQSGYYLNVGGSDLLIQGKIKLKAGVGIERLEEKTVVFTDGSSMPADVIVLATGYEPLQEAVRHLFGGEIAERVGPIWGIGADGELRNMYAPTAQQGFYVLGGGFPAARVYSQYTAIFIKASLEGLLPSAKPVSRSAKTAGSVAELHHA
jgi:cation diffusion facilitator CzcD-associated flavoprotein CzcO